MKENRPDEEEVYRFIFAEVDTVPHLEALLLLWESRPKGWTSEEIAKRLFITVKLADAVLADLARRNLIRATPDAGLEYSYSAQPDRDRIIRLVAETYRSELVRVSDFIHSKASAALREFARAFRFTKEGE